MKRLIPIILIILILVCSCAKQNAVDIDFNIEINGVGYTLPESLQNLEQNGWTLDAKFDGTKEISQNGVKSTYVEKDADNWFNIELFNNDEASKKASECKVGRITYNFDGDIVIKTTGGFDLTGKTLSDVKAKYGEPFSEAEYGGYIEIIYDTDPAKSTLDRITMRFDPDSKKINYIDLIYFG